MKDIKYGVVLTTVVALIVCLFLGGVPVNANSSYEKLVVEEEYTMLSYSDKVYGKTNLKLYTKENYYFVNDIITLDDLRLNAKSEDAKEGDISEWIDIKEIIYENGVTVIPQEETLLNTDIVQVVDVLYSITNSDGKTVDRYDKVYIVGKGSTLIDGEYPLVYFRYISDLELSDGNNALNTLEDNSVWLESVYSDCLSNSLSSGTCLGEYYIKDLANNE